MASSSTTGLQVAIHIHTHIHCLAVQPRVYWSLWDHQPRVAMATASINAAPATAAAVQHQPSLTLYRASNGSIFPESKTLALTFRTHEKGGGGGGGVGVEFDPGQLQGF